MGISVVRLHLLQRPAELLPQVRADPATRPLPQLPMTVDSQGYLLARHDFTEASFWER
jgi:hypothetical protein